MFLKIKLYEPLSSCMDKKVGQILVKFMKKDLSINSGSYFIRAPTVLKENILENKGVLQWLI